MSDITVVQFDSRSSLSLFYADCNLAALTTTNASEKLEAAAVTLIVFSKNCCCYCEYERL